MYKTRIVNFTIAGLAALSACATASRPEVFAREEATMISAEPRIAGGVIAGKNDFKFIAFVHGQVSDTDGSSCTGSLIGPNVVLTAGHCVYTSSGSMYMTSQMNVAFTHTKPTTMSDFTGPAVKEIIVNPNFNRSTLSNDLALIILESDIPSDIATPVKIYTGAITTSTPLTAAGFGITNPSDSSSVSPNLMKVDLVAGTTNYCKSIWSSFDPSKLICTNGAAGKDTCSGDSGGPLATRINNGNDIVLAGITSFAPVTTNNPDGLCAQAGSTGYYVHANYYIDWIAKQAKLDVKSISAANTTSSDSSSDNNSDDDSDVGSNLDGGDNSSINNIYYAHTEFDSNSDSDSSAAPSLVANKKALSTAALGLVAIGIATLF
ncbi:Chymotrypsin-like elastase member 2A [Coemansia sp. RSA 1813]|nr:Chymotrypsin-like elastase member 2A [Coemansia sp. RSA 1646]KAJ1772738.1 Chymotrypsin-like elastase member 2A [Coemansia sp. RSA 1843]KAJ2090689.1 Chymotrypsin-like elastase member 2A [Coemansia sp. RSA 986]KAJ2216107.1 Chymotrypsin-like elastase member 2A [Coemansia sp. RSA 487]KAJ2570092.1 Chymotrypsin-like elastase member 2A [Coemansia sp. RSA 1813]